MITREMLKGSYSEGEALDIYNKVRQTGDFAAFCRCFIHDEDYQVARNALWVLTKAESRELAQLQPMLDTLMQLAISTGNSSVRRLSLNVIERLEMHEDDLRTDFYDFCIAHSVDVNEYPGIQSLCMKLAFRMSAFYPELRGELIRIIKDMEPDYYSPAVKSVRNRILSGKTKSLFRR